MYCNTVWATTCRLVIHLLLFRKHKVLYIFNFFNQTCVGRMTIRVNSRRYFLKVRVKLPRGTEKAHQLVCYGVNDIANVQRVIQSEQLKKVLFRNQTGGFKKTRKHQAK